MVKATLSGLQFDIKSQYSFADCKVTFMLHCSHHIYQFEAFMYGPLIYANSMLFRCTLIQTPPTVLRYRLGCYVLSTRTKLFIEQIFDFDFRTQQRKYRILINFSLQLFLLEFSQIIFLVIISIIQ